MKLAELTKGEFMYYGGIAGIAVLVLLSIILIVIFARRKDKLMNKIEEDF